MADFKMRQLAWKGEKVHKVDLFPASAVIGRAEMLK